MATLLPLVCDDPRLQVFSRFTDAELRSPQQLLGLERTTHDHRVHTGLFIAESSKVIWRAMDADLTPFALVSDKRWVASSTELFDRIASLDTPAPLFVGTSHEIEQLTGYQRTRGPLAAFLRPPLIPPQELLSQAKRVAILENITNYTNIGAIFRSAAALNMDAVLITPGCHDPLYRRAARVSMGTVFQVPWTRIGNNPEWTPQGTEILHQSGFTVAALALQPHSLSLQDPRIAQAEKLALVLGTEGEGLLPSTIDACDYTVTIPMSHHVDSLNVAAASAVAFWETSARA